MHESTAPVLILLPSCHGVSGGDTPSVPCGACLLQSAFSMSPRMWLMRSVTGLPASLWAFYKYFGLGAHRLQAAPCRMCQQVHERQCLALGALESLALEQLAADCALQGTAAAARAAEAGTGRSEWC